MFTKESLYINAVKYDTQLKLDYKKLNNNEIINTNNSVFLVSEDLLPTDIAHKLNASQEEIEECYISTLLISDTTRLVKKEKSDKLVKDCEIASFNNEYDIVVLKNTLFETKHFFEKTGIDYIYSAFHIMNLHLEKNVTKNEFLLFLFNNKAFIMILDKNSSIAYHKIEDLPTIESIKKTHFYEDDIDGQKLFDEIFFLELNTMIHNTLDTFYKNKKNEFVEKLTVLYNLKQLTNEQIQQISEDLLINVDYHPVNIDEEIFELSKDKHHKKSFIKPRKKKKKTNYTNYFIALFFIAALLGIYQVYTSIEHKVENPSLQSVKKDIKIPDHVNINDRVEKRIKAIFDTIGFDIILKELKISKNSLFIKGEFLKDDTYITSLKPNLDKLYEKSEYKLISSDKKLNIEAIVESKNDIELQNIEYKKNTQSYITDEFMPIDRVTEQLKILMPEDTIVKFKSSNNDDLTKFNYMINMIVKSPKEFFDLLSMLNSELYSINIEYPLSMIKTINGIEVEFTLVFNQPK